MATADLTVIALGLLRLKLDERRDREQTLRDKVDSVRRLLEQDG